MYQLLEHTADIGIEAWAKTRLKTMEAMARGLADLMFGKSKASGTIIKTIHLNAAEPEELLVAWLNEILYWCERDNLVPESMLIEELTPNRLQATLAGESFNAQRHHLEHRVKAVTYHQVCLEEAAEGWHAKVYVDL